LSHFRYPLGIPHEQMQGTPPRLSFIAIAPDAQHLAVAAAQDEEPYPTEYTPFIVDTTTHAVTQVVLPHPIAVPPEPVPRRMFAWADPRTLLIFANPSDSPRNSGTTLSYSYDISTHVLTPLPGVMGAIEGVVRCSTLFYLTIGPFTALTPPGDFPEFAAPTVLNRYSLTRHAIIGRPLPIGQASIVGTTLEQLIGMPVDHGGWDVSPDGTRIVFQREAVSVGPYITSSWFAVNADGTGAVAILPGAKAENGVRLAISPDGQQVAVTSAVPTPGVFSGSLAGGATRVYDVPDAYGQPAWLANSTGFFATTSATAGLTAVARYILGPTSYATGAVVITNSNNPATLP
jgi:hypothetical protein